MRKKKVDQWRRLLLALLAALFIIGPIYFMFIAGLMSNVEIQHRPPYLIPPQPTLEHYLAGAKVLKYYLKNSFIIAFATTILTLIIAIPAAFALSKLNLRLAQPLRLLMAFVQITPGAAVVVPLFLMFHKAGLVNTLPSVILGTSAFAIPFATLVLSAYMMRSIPLALLEAAQIDGASLFRIFLKIVLPLARSAIVTTAIFAFLGGWGDLLFSVAFLQKRELQPASVGITTLVSQYGVEWNRLLAASVIYALPPLLVVMVAGKALVAGLTSGAFKE